jgi:hypothetical protein
VSEGLDLVEEGILQEFKLSYIDKGLLDPNCDLTCLVVQQYASILRRLSGRLTCIHQQILGISYIIHGISIEGTYDEVIHSHIAGGGATRECLKVLERLCLLIEGIHLNGRVT